MQSPTHMKESIRLKRCREEMEKAQLEVTVAVSPENVLYFAETYLMTQTDLRERLALTVMPAHADPVMIACKIESHTVEAETWIEDKQYYVEQTTSPIALLAEVLIEKGFAQKKIGIELNYLMAHYYSELLRLMPEAEFVPCTDLFESVRMIKEEREIETLANAGFQTRKAFEAAVLMTRPGDLETQLARRTTDNLYTLGAERIDFIALASGPRSLSVHGLAAETPLTEGEIVRIDFGGVFHNYLSDVARTAGIGRCKPEYVDTFNRLAEAYVNTFDALREGTPACEIYALSAKQYEKVGLPFTMSLVGHGIGIGPHEKPILSKEETQLLKENMIICFEFSVHQHERRFHHEELVRITKGAPQLLTAHRLAPRLLAIE